MIFLGIFRLKMEKLQCLYLKVFKAAMALVLLPCSYCLSESFIHPEGVYFGQILELDLDYYLTGSSVFQLAAKLLIQVGIILVLEWCLGGEEVGSSPGYASWLRTFLVPALVSPALLALLPVLPRFCGAISVAPAALLLAVQAVKDAWPYVFVDYSPEIRQVENFGFYYLLETEWQRLRVPTVLRCY